MAEEVKSEVKEEKAPAKKSFFKSTSFKCIVVLLAIVLICGILLTICNSLFYVSDKERFDRVVKGMYGSEVNYTAVDESEVENLDKEYTNGTILTTSLTMTYETTDDSTGETTSVEKDVTAVAFKILTNKSTGEAINDYLIYVKGKGGYSNGNVSCWVAFSMNDDFTEILGIRSVSISSNKNQSFINKIKDSNLNYFSSAFTGEDYSVQLGTGATYSMTAITNAVNTAMEFVTNQLNTPAEVDNNAEFDSVLTKVYGSVQSYEYVEYNTQVLKYTNGNIELTAIDITDRNNETAEISVVAFKIGGSYNDYLIKATGTGGFNSGTVTVWVAYEMSEDYSTVNSVRKVVIDSNVNQSYIEKITETDIENAFSTYTGEDFDVYTGTTVQYTMKAITNAVNTSKNFVTSVLLGGAE